MHPLVKAAFKGAIQHLRSDMAKRISGHPVDDTEHDPTMPPAGMHEDPGMENEDSPGEEQSEGDEGGLSDEEKREAMYGKKRPMPKAGIAIMIAAGKKPGMSKRK